MINYNGFGVPSMYLNGYGVIAIYLNGYYVWPPIIPTEPDGDTLCCFGNGYWIDDYPWVDDMAWVD